MFERIGERERAGEDAVVTCSALKRSYRDLLRMGHPSVVFAHLVAPAPELASRLEQRKGHYMPPSLLESQLDTLEPLGPDEPGITVPDLGTPEHVLGELLARLALANVSGARGAGRASGGTS